ncbi:MAG: zinc-ribbon domain-containing protein [Bacteroidia bacterium]|nr:zinc-ribbon domain-containing protein [Bacteroidia bacterium]
MIIIWGTYHLMKNNPRVHNDTCPHCGAFSRLESHEATHFFHLYYIPLIPLGKKRIESKCSRCNKYMTMSYKDWVKVKAAGESFIAENAQVAFQDPANAIAYHEMVDRFKGLPAAREVAQIMRTEFAEQPEVLAYLGNWFRSVGLRNEAVPYFDRVIELDPTHTLANRFKGHTYLNQKDLVNAALQFARMETPDTVLDFQVLLKLAIDLNKANYPEESYKLMVYMLDKFPAAAKNSQVKSTIKSVEKKLGIQESALGAW